MEKWSEKRNAVNRYFVSRGYTNINANQKPWCEGPYGRDRIFVGENYTNRNALTTDATARLLLEIGTSSGDSQAIYHYAVEERSTVRWITSCGGFGDAVGA